MTVAVANLVKRFGAFTALNDVSLAARPGEFLALLGPSGSGKTTLLRIMAGLEFPDAGSVTFDGVDVSDRPAGGRGVGFVFQHYALFKHMTVAKNVAFGLEVKRRRDRPAAAVIAARVAELLGLVQLGGMAQRYPSQLSGGQRQRVALARALAVGPRLLLLDEPFGALDAKVRKELRRWLRDLHERVGLTSVFVTHDQEEALELADRVAVMDHGVIEQVGTPSEIYDSPASGFVCRFLGAATRLPATLDGDAVTVAGRRFANAAGRGGGAGTAYVRAHDWTVDPDGLPVTVRRLLRVGAATLVEGVLADGGLVEAQLGAPPAGLVPGDTLALTPTLVRAWTDQRG